MTAVRPTATSIPIFAVAEKPDKLDGYFGGAVDSPLVLRVFEETILVPVVQMTRPLIMPWATKAWKQSRVEFVLDVKVTAHTCQLGEMTLFSLLGNMRVSIEHIAEGTRTWRNGR
jgi:hypothetical protein